MLTQEQRRVVEFEMKDFAVLASAGAGKTRCVAARVDWLVQNGAMAENILVITFTRKAAREIRERCDRNIWSGTMHSICYDVISRHEDIRVMSPFEADLLLRRCAINTGACKWDKVTKKSKWIIPQWRCREVTEDPSKAAEPEEQRLVKNYRSQMQASACWDYASLISKVRSYPAGFAKVEHLIVDEAQDTDESQWSMIDFILESSRPHCTAMYVGDLKQSIYEWRNARPDLFANRSKATLPLTKTFRFGSEIAEVANNLIRNNPEGTAIVAHNEGSKVTCNASTVASVVDRMLGDFIPVGEIAVLCRSNASVTNVEMELKSAGIPCEAAKPAHRPGIIYWLLAYCVSPYSQPVIEGLSQCLDMDADALAGGPEATFARLSSGDRLQKDAAKAVMASMGRNPTVSQAISELEHEFFAPDKIWWLNNYDGWTIRSAVSDWSLPREEETERQAVSIMTIHQAKGLEFDAVIIADLEDGEFPKRSSLQDIRKLEEERRCAYVAMTRARHWLHLGYQRNPSQFIKEAAVCPEEFSDDLSNDYATGVIQFPSMTDEDGVPF